MSLNEKMPTTPFISIIYREHAKYLNEKVKDENLSFGLYPLLIEIYYNEGIIQEQLAQKLHLNESTITRNLKKLEEKEFIEKIKNKRTNCIKLTKKGKTTIEKVLNYDDEWEEIIKKSISDEEYDNFKKTLKKISDELL